MIDLKSEQRTLRSPGATLLPRQLREVHATRKWKSEVVLSTVRSETRQRAFFSYLKIFYLELPSHQQERDDKPILLYDTLAMENSIPKGGFLRGWESFIWGFTSETRRRVLPYACNNNKNRLSQLAVADRASLHLAFDLSSYACCRPLHHKENTCFRPDKEKQLELTSWLPASRRAVTSKQT